MPVFDFTSPEGKTYSVTGPEGATKEQAFQILQSQLSQGVDPNIPTVEVRAKRLSDQIPNEFATPEQLHAQAMAAPPSAPADPSLIDRVLGAGESMLTLGTGATTGALGMLAGGLAGAVGNLTGGRFGMKDGVEAGMQQGAESLTYQPRTPMGQEYAGAMGEALHQTLPAIPLTAELAALGRSAAPVARGVSDIARAGRVAAAPAVEAVVSGAQKVREASPAIVARVQKSIRRNPEAKEVAGGSVGAAGADMADARHAAAADYPVPFKLTQGEATRDPVQLAFEGNTAKGEMGAPLRQRHVDNNEAAMQNFEGFIDSTGANTVDPGNMGRSVISPLAKEMRQDRAKVRVAYKKAENSPEAMSVVDPGEVILLPYGEDSFQGSLIDYFNSKPAGLNSTKLLDDARTYAIKYGVAEKDGNGNLIPRETTVKNMEALRKEINGATGIDPSDILDSSILKGIIDAQTEPLAGPLYRYARRLRSNLSARYEDRAIISKLLNNKRSSRDRQVAFEDVFDHIVVNGTREDNSFLRAALRPSTSPEGAQAVKNIQGQLLERIKNEAFSNVETNQAGQRVISASKLENAIRKYDEGGKLDFWLGKKGAEKLRDMSELIKIIKTVPKETAINHSNSGIYLAAAMDVALGGLSGLPVPIATTLRIAAKQIKDRKIRARVQEALNPPKRNRTPEAP
jgi:hypothetical protein